MSALQRDFLIILRYIPTRLLIWQSYGSAREQPFFIWWIWTGLWPVTLSMLRRFERFFPRFPFRFSWAAEFEVPRMSKRCWIWEYPGASLAQRRQSVLNLCGSWWKPLDRSGLWQEWMQRMEWRQWPAGRKPVP